MCMLWSKSNAAESRSLTHIISHLHTFTPEKISAWTGGENPRGSSPRRGGDGYASEAGRIAARCSELWSDSRGLQFSFHHFTFGRSEPLKVLEELCGTKYEHEQNEQIPGNYSWYSWYWSFHVGRFMSFRCSLKPGGKCSQTSRRPDSELAKSVSGQLDQSDEALPWHRSISSAQYA